MNALAVLVDSNIQFPDWVYIAMSCAMWAAIAIRAVIPWVRAFLIIWEEVTK